MLKKSIKNGKQHAKTTHIRTFTYVKGHTHTSERERKIKKVLHVRKFRFFWHLEAPHEKESYLFRLRYAKKGDERKKSY